MEQDLYLRHPDALRGVNPGKILAKPLDRMAIPIHAPGTMIRGSGFVANQHAQEATRRDFLYVATTAFAGVGAVMTAWPFIDQMAPDAAALALGSTEVDLSKIPVGQSITVTWRGKPVFIRHRSEGDIKAARDVDVTKLPDPVPDSARVKKPEWLVVVGVCTHLGCIPLAQPNFFGGTGWFCLCHG